MCKTDGSVYRARHAVVVALVAWTIVLVALPAQAQEHQWTARRDCATEGT